MAGSLQQLPEVWLQFSNEHQSLGKSWTAFTNCALAPWHLCWRESFSQHTWGCYS